ncbi:MAG: glycosyltransferase family 39 protein, partial [Candidatus Gastranaerophilaceae bacterium]
MSLFFAKHKTKIFPFILIIIYALFVFLSWGKWGHFLADSFREAVIPQELLNGKVLYSDITNLYPPLAYQLNALLYLIFGNSLNTLYIASILCSVAVLSIIYKLAKEYSSDFTAFIIVLTAMEIFVFRVNILNSASWIFPYSYSFLYAFTACIFAFAAYCRYKKDNHNKYLYLTFLLTGLSVAFKYDFLLFVFLPLYEVLKNKSMKQIIYGILLFLFPSLMSFGIYLFTGGTLSAL